MHSINLPVLAVEKYCWLMAVVPRPLAGGKAIILGRVFNDGRNFYIFNYSTFSLQTQSVEVFHYFKPNSELHSVDTFSMCNVHTYIHNFLKQIVHVQCASKSALGVYLLIVWQQTK